MVGHRGARGLAPENTLAGLEMARRCGARMVEVDVVLSRDRVAVVAHDDTLGRISDVHHRFPERDPWWIRDFDLAELCLLDAGTWFAELVEDVESERRRVGFDADHAEPRKDGGDWRLATLEERRDYLDAETLEGFRNREIRIPTLEQALDWCNQHDMDVNIELKRLPRFPEGLGEEVLAVVRRLGLEHRVLVSSFDHECLRDLKRSAPELAVGVLCHDRLVGAEEYVEKRVGADWVHPAAHHGGDVMGAASGELEMARRWIEPFLRAGIRVLPWTVNDPAVGIRLRELGAAGLITDYPCRFVDGAR